MSEQITQEELDELRKDKARLDWLAGSGQIWPDDPFNEGKWTPEMLRWEIDRLMKYGVDKR